MMQLLSTLFFALLDTISFAIIYQLFVIKKKDSKLKLGVFFAFIYMAHLLLDMSQLSHILIFYALLIVTTNGLLRYDIKASAFFSLQSFLILTATQLFAVTNILLWQSQYINPIYYWIESNWLQKLFYLGCLVVFALTVRYLYSKIKQKVGVSRSITSPVRSTMIFMAMIFVMISLWLFTFLSMNWQAIVAIQDLKQLLTVGYYMMIIGLYAVGYLAIYNLCFKHKFNRVSHMAENDPLSGLMSRSAGMNFLRKSFNHAKLSGQRLTVAFVDVNDLKIVNDKHGHHAGDHLIEKIAEVIKASIRDTDGAMRFGGDEFILVLPDCPQYRAEEIMTQINVYLNRLNLSGDLGYKIGVSHGLVEYNPLRHSSALDLIAEADTEMYKNKKKNKHSNN